MKLKKTTSVGELKQQLCERINLSSSSIRLFFDGERLQDECIIDFLRDGDVIEAFKGCSGGGPPTKKLKPFNEDQIKDALNKSLEDSDDYMNAPEDALETETNLNLVKLNEKETERPKEEESNEEHDENNSKQRKDNRACLRQDGENAGKIPAIDRNMNVVSNSATIADMETMKEAKLKDDLWLEELRVQKSNGELQGTSSLHMQLKFYLDLPTLAEAEKTIVKNLLERIKMHSE
jgi:hypothetical protein